MAKKLKPIDNDIALRPRFQLQIPYNHSKLLDCFEQLGSNDQKLKVSRVDDHLFIKYRFDKPFWTPQLHLEINAVSSDTSKIYGLFGPKPSIWLLFMFLHFLVAVLFIGFTIWAYTKYTLDQSYLIQSIIVISLVTTWLLLYVVGRMGRYTAKPQMQELKCFMDHILETIEYKPQT